IVARNVKIASTAPATLTIDGIVMAGAGNTANGSFYAEQYNARPIGVLHLRGGVIQKARGPVGTFSGGAQATGYAKDYSYDPRMRVQPPPFFPTTGGYDRLSWRRIGAG